MNRPCFLILLILFTLASCTTTQTTSKQDKERALAVQRVGEEHYRDGRYTAALKNLLEAEKLLPGDPYIQNSLGLAYLAKKRPDLSISHFKKALTIKPDYIQATNNLGGAYFKLKKWDLAIESFEQVASNLLYPTPEIPISNQGWVYFQQKRYKEARRHFDKALEIRPDFLNAVHGIASIYLETRSISKAYTYIQKALDKNPGAAILHADLAKAYEALLEYKKAKKAWIVVQKLAPKNSPLAKEARKKLSVLQ